MGHVCGIQISNLQNNKNNKIRQLYQRLKDKGYVGTKLKNNWSFTQYHQWLDQVFKLDNDLSAMVSHKQHENFKFSHQVVTFLLNFNYISPLNPSIDIYTPGPGQWVSISSS